MGLQKYIHRAVYRGDLKYLRTLLTDFEFNQSLKEKVVLWACKYGRLGVVKFMRNEIDLHFGREEPFLTACNYGQLKVVKYLVEKHKVDINCRHGLGLELAIKNECKDVVKYLMLMRQNLKYPPCNLKYNRVLYWNTVFLWDSSITKRYVREVKFRV